VVWRKPHQVGVKFAASFAEAVDAAQTATAEPATTEPATTA
jgi:hypothetical protein